MKKPRGIVLYEGPSNLTGDPIVVVAVLKSGNRKTGNMVQAYIIRSDMDPVAAIKLVADDAVCGGCASRQSVGGHCYVNVGQSVLAVYKAYKRGSYVEAKGEALEYLVGRSIRFGSYGDPAAAPTFVWKMLAGLASNVTGYTHQVAHKSFDRELLNYCMVSADTPRAALAQHAKGVRTFRVKTPEGSLLPNELECLAESEGLTCIECGVCNGGDGKNVAISVHGTFENRYIDRYSKANIIAVG